MEFHAAATAHRTERQGSSRVPGSVYPRPVGTPSADSGKGTAALVAQKATLNIDGARTFGQVNATLIQDAVKSAAPDKAQALVNMSSSGPALNTVEPMGPCTCQVNRGQERPRQSGQQHLRPMNPPPYMEMNQVKITNNQASPTTVTRSKVITKPEKSLRPMQEDRAEKP